MHIGTIKILASIYFFPRGEISPDSTQINILLLLFYLLHYCLYMFWIEMLIRVPVA